MRVIITREISPFNGNPRSSFPTLFLAQFSCVKVEEGIRSIPRNKESKEKRKKKKTEKKVEPKEGVGDSVRRVQNKMLYSSFFHCIISSTCPL